MNDYRLAVETFRLAEDYAAGRAVDGVDVDAEHVWLTLYDALLALPPAEREVRIAQAERVMHAPTAH